MKQHLKDQLYKLIAESISSNQLPEGTLLLEGKLAEVFSVSRSPVRQALAMLNEAGLIRTFDGRGYLVGQDSTCAVRRDIHVDMFAELASDKPKKTESWRSVYGDIERALLHHSLFGSHRINELELSKHYAISRTVSNQVLTRLQGLGLVEKDERSRWQLIEWDDQRLADLYEVRRRLEPYVLIRAADHLPAAKIELFIGRLLNAIRCYPDMQSRQFDELESDLHIRTLSYCPNREMLMMLRRTHSLLLSGKHILLDKSYFPEEEPFFQEHLQIFTRLQQNDAKGAAECMEEHLLIAEQKVSQRLAVFKKTNTVSDAPYLELLRDIK